jgi:hypothetical protein
MIISEINWVRRVRLVQLVRFLVVELNYTGSNPKFDMSVIFTANYFFSGMRHLCRQRYALDDRFHKSLDQAESVF